MRFHWKAHKTKFRACPPWLLAIDPVRPRLELKSLVYQLDEQPTELSHARQLYLVFLLFTLFISSVRVCECFFKEGGIERMKKRGGGGGETEGDGERKGAGRGGGGGAHINDCLYGVNYYLDGRHITKPAPNTLF